MVSGVRTQFRSYTSLFLNEQPDLWCCVVLCVKILLKFGVEVKLIITFSVLKKGPIFEKFGKNVFDK